jgi:hypothetical protein
LIDDCVYAIAAQSVRELKDMMLVRVGVVAVADEDVLRLSLPAFCGLAGEQSIIGHDRGLL